MRIADTFHKRTVVVVAIASLGISALAGCTAVAKPQPPTLTTKAAAALYLDASCSVDAAVDLWTNAVNIARDGTATTGPDLDNLKSASLGYQKATSAAAVSLGHPKAAWPTSVRKSIAVVRAFYLNEQDSLASMADATTMSDEADAYGDVPSPKKSVAASKLIRSKLGLPSPSAPNSCPPPPPLTIDESRGVLITGTGYTYNAPTGWTLPKRAEQADSYAIAAKPDAKGLYDTVNVLGAESNGDSFDAEEQNGVEYLDQVVKAADIQVRPRVEIAGELSVHISSLVTHQGVTRWNEQYLVNHDGNAFTITFNFDEAETQSAREALANSVLASWNWTS